MVFPFHSSCILEEGGVLNSEEKHLLWRMSWHLSVSEESGKGEEIAEVGNRPHHIPLLDPSTEHLICSPHMQQELLGVPLRGSHFHKGAVKK